MERLKLSRVCTMGLVMLGLVMTWSFWVPGTISPTAAAALVGSCGDCAAHILPKCPVSDHATGACTVSYYRCDTGPNNKGTCTTWTEENACNSDNCAYANAETCQGI